MARKAKTPIAIPSGVDVKIDGNKISAKGPKGALSQELTHSVTAKIEDKHIYVTLDEAIAAAQGTKFLGLRYSLIKNMVEGVGSGFQKVLEMIGVGYRAAIKGHSLEVQVGYSHPITFPIPAGMHVVVDKNTKIIISGADKQAIGQFASVIRATRKPEPYKGKGIRYEGEYVRRKAGKSGKK
jgi:large subunit ribosomal protein L6